MNRITVNKKRLVPYLILMVVLYVLLGIAYTTRGLDNFPSSSLLSVFVMPVAILLIGIADISLSNRAKIIWTALFLLYIPTHIITFVLGDYSIELLIRFFFNSLAVFGVIMLLTAISLNLRVATIICCVLAFTILTLNIYVVAFRGTAINPGDILAFKTALKVSGGYKYFINLSMVSSAMYSIIIVQLIGRLCISLKEIKLGTSLIIRFVCLVLALSAGTVVIKCAHQVTYLGTDVYDGFDINMTNQKIGTILTFIVTVQGSKLEPPEDYSVESAESILQDTPKAEDTTEDVQPNIIVIMNEAFSDLDKLYKIDPSEDPLSYWHSLTENTISGDLMVSVDGGGTSYTEFEFLTGLAGGIIPPSITPYLDSIKKDTHSLAWDLKKDGYTNIAIHPFWGSCWNREIVYPLLGFDKFIAGEDFSSEEKVNQITAEHITTRTNLGDDLEYLRNYVSDRESYRRVIDSFENKADGEKLFVFNVTVQNHSGYDYEGDDFTADVTSPKDTDGELNQYLSVIKQSDIAYSELVEYFKNYDEPTIILMFGDHQPGIQTDFRSEVRDEYLEYEQNGSLEHYIVPYKLWANYDIDTKRCDITGSSYLSLMVKDVAGIEYNSWDDFRVSMKSAFDAVTLEGYLTDGATKTYSSDDDEKNKLIEQYEKLEYYMLIEQGLMEDNK